MNEIRKETKALEDINGKVDDLSKKLDKLKLFDYVYYLDKPRKMFWPNFIAGLSRGLGITVGLTILGALLLYLLQWVVSANLPIISEFIGKLISLVDYYLRNR